MVIASELKPGTFIRVDGRIYRVLEVEAKAGAAKLGGVVRTKLANVTSGRMWEPHFRPQERLEEVEVEQRTMQFLFHDADSSTFMDPQSFEQVAVPRAMLGLARAFLEAGMELPLEFFEGQPLNVVLPDIVEAQIASTAPPAHSQQDSAWKEATLDNGLRILVPLFIATGEVVRVDVKSGRYVERARAERRRSA